MHKSHKNAAILGAALALAAVAAISPARAQDAAAPTPPATAPAPAAAAMPAAVAPAPTLFPNPDQQFTVAGQLKVPQKTVHLPVTQVKWMLKGKFTARGGVFRGASSSKEVVSDVDAPRVRRIAQVLHDDLTAQLRAAGWTVRTRQDMGANAPNYAPAAPDAQAGYPIENANTGALQMTYAVLAPEGMPALMLSGMTGTGGMAGFQGLAAIGNAMALPAINNESFRYARENPGVVLLVDYGFATAALGETQSRELGTHAAPSLVLTGGYMAFSPDSTSRVTIKDGVEVATGIGQFAETGRTSTATNVLRFVAGMNTMDNTSLVLTTDWDKAEAEALRAGRALNSQIVARLGA